MQMLVKEAVSNMKNTLYGIGLDIGVASVGWAVVGLNGTGEPVGLHRLGVRIFDKAEQRVISA